MKINRTFSTKSQVARFSALAIISGWFFYPMLLLAQGGMPLSTNRLVGLGAPLITLDSSGNLFAMGSWWNGSFNDYVTYAYSSAGLPRWTNYLAGPGSGFSAMAVDNSGNVLVTANYSTIKYSGMGIPMWTNQGGSTAIAVSGSGDVLVTGGYETVAYSSSGAVLWRYVGYPSGWAIAVDNDGNAFVTGELAGIGTDLDFATVKYSKTGVPLWTNVYNGPGNGRDQAFAISLDRNGNVFVTGPSDAPNGFPDYATIKYSSAGLPLWTNRYNGTGNLWDYPAAIAVDSAGNVFATGTSSNGSTDDYATIKYSNAGVLLWARRYNGSLNGWDSPHSIALDSAGNVFVTGESDVQNPVNGFSDFATVAYSNAGEPLWIRRYNGPANGSDLGSAIAVDRNGNVFVAGTSGKGDPLDCVEIKYSSSVPPPRLDFRRLINHLVLSWTNAGFNLQSAPSVSGTFTNIPGATNPYTNLLTAPRQFFRLIGN